MSRTARGSTTGRGRRRGAAGRSWPAQLLLGRSVGRSVGRGVGEGGILLSDGDDFPGGGGVFRPVLAVGRGVCAQLLEAPVSGLANPVEPTVEQPTRPTVRPTRRSGSTSSTASATGRTGGSYRVTSADASTWTRSCPRSPDWSPAKNEPTT
jgi:hypothetical protein